MSEWYYIQNGQRCGPVGEPSLREMAASGQLRPEDAVWTDGMTNWEPAGRTAALFPMGPPPLPIGYALPPSYGSPTPLGQDAGMRWLLPVGRSGWAIAAGYLGLFSLLLVPGPFAVACGILAIRDIRRHPSRHGMGRAVFGIVLGLLGTGALVFVIISAVAHR